MSVRESFRLHSTAWSFKSFLRNGFLGQICLLFLPLMNSSVVAASQPWKWFRLQGFVNDSRASRTLCRVRAGNAELGNRYKDRYGCTHVLCPWCLSKGVRARLVESHLILICPCVAAHRRDFGIADYHSSYVVHGKKPLWQILRAYLVGDGSDQVVLLERGRRMAVLLESWLERSHECL